MSEPDWKRVWTSCCRIIRRWRVPPRWSDAEWFDEICAEAFAAAMEAMNAFDPSYGVPPTLFIRGRILNRAIARYRKEWTYALRRAPSELLGQWSGAEEVPEELATNRVDLLQGLSRLSETDRRLIERLYWRGESEAQVAADLGITQQGVNKRKRLILMRLRRLLEPAPRD